MKDDLSCQNCLWFGNCGHAEPCEFYEDADTEDENAEEAYRRDLDMRYQSYERQVEGQDA